MPFTSKTAKTIGRMGGLATKQKMLAEEPDYYARIGYKAGKALLDAKGKEYYSTIGSIKRGQGKKHKENI